MPSRIRTTHVLTLKTYSSTICTGPAVASMVASVVPITQPPLACKMKILCTGTPCVGSVTITGTLLGVSVIEVINFTVATNKNSTKLWDNVTSVTTAGLTAAVTVTVTAIDALSQPIRRLEDSVDYPCVFSTLGGLQASITMKQLGITANELHYVRTRAPIFPDCEFTVNGKTYVPVTMISSVLAPGTDEVLEYECNCVRK
jgi:hypothetical protein